MELARAAGSITSSLPGWLHRVATNLSYSKIRSAIRRRDREQKAADLAVPEASSWESVSVHVDRALAELPEEIRDVVVLHFLEGVGQVEISQRLGVNQSTISRRLKWGVEQLRTQLRKAGVATSFALLFTMLAENALATVPPPALALNLGKMALAGMGPRAAKPPVSLLETPLGKGLAAAALVIVGIGALLLLGRGPLRALFGPAGSTPGFVVAGSGDAGLAGAGHGASRGGSRHASGAAQGSADLSLHSSGEPHGGMAGLQGTRSASRVVVTAATQAGGKDEAQDAADSAAAAGHRAAGGAGVRDADESVGRRDPSAAAGPVGAAPADLVATGTYASGEDTPASVAARHYYVPAGGGEAEQAVGRERSGQGRPPTWSLSEDAGADGAGTATIPGVVTVPNGLRIKSFVSSPEILWAFTDRGMYGYAWQSGVWFRAPQSGALTIPDGLIKKADEGAGAAPSPRGK